MHDCKSQAANPWLHLQQNEKSTPLDGDNCTGDQAGLKFMINFARPAGSDRDSPSATHKLQSGGLTKHVPVSGPGHMQSHVQLTLVMAGQIQTGADLVDVLMVDFWRLMS